MAKVQGYACDQCEKFSAEQNGWFTVGELGNEATNVELCSLDCVRKYALDALRATGATYVGGRPQQNKAESNGQGEPTSYVEGFGEPVEEAGKLPCEVCGKLTSKSYMGSHLRNAHGIFGGLSGQVRQKRVSEHVTRTPPVKEEKA